jgi:hypothetical protein
VVAALTRADPVPRDSALTELRLVQPVIMVRGSLGSWSLHATANLEGLTLADGELAPGAWGEGYMDRRHPHTYAHELMLDWRHRLGAFQLGAAIGKGFVPFGTDDPMVRPVLRYPVNHHLSQILERAVVLVGARSGPVVLEAAAFNGDEPEQPRQWPNLERFGDSWSVRVTWLPRSGVESQASLAHVLSPEHRPGAGPDQWKWSAALRWQRPIARTPVYALIEWARTSELDGLLVFSSGLAEGAAQFGRHGAWLRLERTERPEEQRVLNPFRSQRPHLENSILGVTGWTVVTVGYSFAGPHWKRLQVMPLAELSYAHVSRITTGVFDPSDFYGRATIWSVTMGMRVDAGARRHRMGLYGVRDDDTGSMPGHNR